MTIKFIYRKKLYSILFKKNKMIQNKQTVSISKRTNQKVKSRIKDIKESTNIKLSFDSCLNIILDCIDEKKFNQRKGKMIEILYGGIKQKNG